MAQNSAKNLCILVVNHPDCTGRTFLVGDAHPTPKIKCHEVVVSIKT